MLLILPLVFFAILFGVALVVIAQWAGRPDPMDPELA